MANTYSADDIETIRSTVYLMKFNTELESGAITIEIQMLIEQMVQTYILANVSPKELMQMHRDETLPE